MSIRRRRLAERDPRDPLLGVPQPLDGDRAKAHVSHYCETEFEESPERSATRVAGTLYAVAAIARDLTTHRAQATANLISRPTLHLRTIVARSGMNGSVWGACRSGRASDAPCGPCTDLCDDTCFKTCSRRGLAGQVLRCWLQSCVVPIICPSRENFSCQVQRTWIHMLRGRLREDRCSWVRMERIC